MKFFRLVSADIIRDGGSYEAIFSTDEPLLYHLFLQCDHRQGLVGSWERHRYLYAYRSENYRLPDDALPVVTGSEEEQEIYRLLDSFLASVPADTNEYSLTQLKEMVVCIHKREPIFPDDPAFKAKK